MNPKLIEKGQWWEEGVQLIDGCTPCSPGCDHCWSADLTRHFMTEMTVHNYCGQEKARRNLHIGIDGKFNGYILTHPERLSRFNTRKPKVFAIWNDLFHEDVPFEFIWEAKRFIAGNPQNTFIVLTKRAQRIVDFIAWVMNELRSNPDYALYDLPPYSFPENWWNGLTICTQPEAFDKESDFIKVPGNKFLCLEPLLTDIPFLMLKNISAVIVGTETGPHRRPAKLEWIESIIDQCDTAGVPVFVKALEINGKVSKDMNDFPQKLRRRELPWM